MKWWQRRDVSCGILPPILAYLNQIEPWWKVAQEWDEAKVGGIGALSGLRGCRLPAMS